jgi:hypothetical protein
MSGALGARRFGVQDGAVLTGVQLAPLPFGLMVVEFAGCGALGNGGKLAGLHGSDRYASPGAPSASPRRWRSKGFPGPECAGTVPDLPCPLDGDTPGRGAYRPPTKRDAQGGPAERFEAPLGGSRLVLVSGVGGTFPARPFSRREKRERGSPSSLLPQAFSSPHPTVPTCRPTPLTPYLH